VRATKKAGIREFALLIPVSRELCCGDRFVSDWTHRQSPDRDEKPSKIRLSGISSSKVPAPANGIRTQPVLSAGR